MRILIAGAGVAGLSLTASLEAQLDQEDRDIDLEIEIIEKRQSEEAGNGYAIALLKNGLEFLERLDLAEKVLSKSRKLEDFSLFNVGGEKIGGRSGLDTEGDFGVGVAIQRNDLMRALQSAVATKVHYSTEFSEEIEEFEKYLETFDIVVGADGLHSQVRERFFSEKQAKKIDLGINSWSCEFAQSSVISEKFQSSVNEIRTDKDDKGIFVGGYRIADDRLLGLITSETETDIDAALERLDSPLLKDRGDLVEESIYHFRQAEIIADKWRVENKFIIGDAAHALSPASGMGASQAIIDGYLLGVLISQAATESIDLEQMYKDFDQLVESRNKQIDFLRELSHKRLENQDMDRFLY
jgi:2-polyprenyl-6-methoxyphenol hydroxylase-like FAD-dependent oxidoreductase